MDDFEKILDKIQKNTKSVRFNDLKKLCIHYFGDPRQSGSSHVVFKTPWQGDPRVNIQNDKGKAKAYQVKQVLSVIKRLDDEKNK